MGSKHQALVKTILLELGSRPDMRLWEAPVGLARSYDGSRTYQYGLTGCADIIGIYRPHGRFIAIEAKVGDDVQRESQAHFQNMIESFGGVYVIAYSAEEAREILLARLALPNAEYERLASDPSIPPGRPGPEPW